MIISNDLFTSFGELRDQQKEKDFKQEYWASNSKAYFISYNTCCILLLFAGVFIDFQREFYSGSALYLTLIRLGLVLCGLLMIPLFKKKKHRPKHLDKYCFFLMIYSAVIIFLLTVWTKGSSFTLMPGVLVTMASFYIALPSKLLHAFTSSLVLFLTYCFLFNYQLVGIKAHYYMCFMLLSTNLILIYFKIIFNKNNRSNFLLKQYHKEVGQAKDNILSIIGHDLKNPLTIVSNKINFAKKSIINEQSEKALAHLETAKKSCSKLEELLQGLLQWAISENRELCDSSKSYSIKKYCLRAIEQYQESAQLKNITIKSDIEDLDFIFNANMIETIIRNLLSNSIKFTDKGKEITVVGEKSNDFYKLKVRDQGTGMTQAKRQSILSGSEYTSTNGTSGERGNGLGLKLVSHFIQTHKGNFDILILKDQGCEFIVNLPYNQ